MTSKVGVHPLLARTVTAKELPVAKPQPKVVKQPVDRYVKSGVKEKTIQSQRTVTRASKHAKTGDVFAITDDKPGALNTLLSKLPKVQKSGSFQVSTAGVTKQGGFKAMNGVANGSYSAEFLKAEVAGSGSVQISKGKFIAKGNISAEASLVNVNGKVSLGKGDYKVDASGEMFVGARGQADGTLIWNPKKGEVAAKIHGEAFVGAKVSGEANVKLGKYGSAGVHGELQVGLGASFKAEAAYKNGRFKARVEVGACLGLGFKLGFNVDINVKGIVNAVKAPFKAVANVVSNVTQKVTSTVKNAVKSVGNFFKSLF